MVDKRGNHRVGVHHLRQQLLAAAAAQAQQVAVVQTRRTHVTDMQRSAVLSHQLQFDISYLRDTVSIYNLHNIWT